MHGDGVRRGGQTGQARENFIAYVQSRMRRVLRGHDKPYAIFEPFGARPDGDFNETEEFLLDNLAKVAEGSGSPAAISISTRSISGWISTATSKKCDPQRFPNGLTKIDRRTEEAGDRPGPVDRQRRVCGGRGRSAAIRR